MKALQSGLNCTNLQYGGHCSILIRLSGCQNQEDLMECSDICFRTRKLRQLYQSDHFIPLLLYLRRIVGPFGKRNLLRCYNFHVPI